MKCRWPILVVLLVAFAMGLQWPALQVAAWTGMTLKNARHLPLGAALAKAVRGDRPCVVCRLVRDGQQAEQEQRDTLHVERLEGVQQVASFDLCPRLILQGHAPPAVGMPDRLDPPPLPPPRAA